MVIIIGFICFVLFKTPGWYRAQPLQEALVRGGHMVEGVGCHLASAVVAGVTATMVASPVDVVKTRSASRLELQTKSTLWFSPLLHNGSRDQVHERAPRPVQLRPRLPARHRGGGGAGGALQVQYSTVQYSTVHYSAVQYSTVQRYLGGSLRAAAAWSPGTSSSGSLTNRSNCGQ